MGSGCPRSDRCGIILLVWVSWPRRGGPSRQALDRLVVRPLIGGDIVSAARRTHSGDGPLRLESRLLKDAPSLIDDTLDSAASAFGPGDGRTRRRGLRMGAWGVLRTVLGLASGFGRDTRPRTSAELTTQLAGGRGEALREAHRTLKRHMASLPALRRVAPQLSVLERTLAKQGSRALARLPIGVLHQALRQLELIQNGQTPPADAEHLAVLHQRLLEAIAARNPRMRLHDEGPDTIANHESLLGRGLEVRDISVDEYDRAVRASDAPPTQPQRH